MVDQKKIRAFLFVYVKEHLRDVPQAEAMNAIGYTTFDAIVESRMELFSVSGLVNVLNRLGIDQQEVLESARFHSSLTRC